VLRVEGAGAQDAGGPGLVEDVEEPGRRGRGGSVGVGAGHRRGGQLAGAMTM
jgi:hypothetical protein